MFRHREVIIWIDLKHFKGIYEYKFLLLEYTRVSHFLRDVFTLSTFVFNPLAQELDIYSLANHLM